VLPIIVGIVLVSHVPEGQRDYAWEQSIQCVTAVLQRFEGREDWYSRWHMDVRLDECLRAYFQQHRRGIDLSSPPSDN
jgi:hypothetical protein